MQKIKTKKLVYYGSHHKIEHKKPILRLDSRLKL